MRKKIICTLAAAMIVTTTAAFGAVKEGSYSVTPMVGRYNYVDDPSEQTTSVLGIRGGYNVTKSIGIEALLDYVANAHDLSGTSFTMQRLGGQALYHFFPDNVFVPYIAAGLSGLHFNGDNLKPNNGSNILGAFDYGIGAKYFLQDDLAIRGDVRHIIYKFNDREINNVEVTLGAYFQFGGTAPAMKAVVPEPEPVKVVAAPAAAPEPVAVVVAPAPPADSDGDGIIDTLDKCSGTPQGVAVDGSGCPVDADKDGIADYLDKCPETPAGVAVDTKGCPVDSDNDGVADYLDKCPATPAGVAVDAKGCPVDADNDGVADYLDKCPTTPAGVAVDTKGCPIDSDSDGVADYLDKCPATPVGVAVDAKGCPLEVAKKFCDKPSVIAVAFDANKAEVKAKYHEELDKLGNFLKEFPNAKGTIEGYTDADGSKEANMKLSQARAENVRSYIINKFGIDGSRLSAKGYGPDKPIASNKTNSGKAKNRRIESAFSCD